MANKSYVEKLKDPRWQKKRLKILERDHWRCRNCDDTESTLHVHHKDYIPGSEPWDYPDEYLITVCESCHEFIERVRPGYEKRIIENFRLKTHRQFDMYCVADIFSHEKLHDLIFYVWHMGVTEVVEYLHKIGMERYTLIPPTENEENG